MDSPCAPTLTEKIYSQINNTKKTIPDSQKNIDKPNKPENTTTVENIHIETFELNIKNFVEKYSPKVYLLVPCFQSVCYVNFVICLFETIQCLEKLNIKVCVEFCKNDSLIPRARNNLIAKAMNDPLMTHILFIDNDIHWQPIELLKLLISNKPIVGGAYPLKKYNWDFLLSSSSSTIQKLLEKKKKSQFNELITDTDYLRYHLLKYNVNFLSNEIKIEEPNLVKVRHIASGFMMIQRKTIEQMSQAFSSTKYTDDIQFLTQEENKYAYALFDCGVEDDHYYSEDWLFCHRWLQMGGDIWLDISVKLSHQGTEIYEGFLLPTLLS